MQINRGEDDETIFTLTQEEVEQFIKIGLIKKKDIVEVNNMEELIKEIKEKAQMLVDKYNMQDISVYIDESKSVYIGENESDILRDKKEVHVKVRMQGVIYETMD